MLTIPIERQSAFSWQSYDLLGNLIDDPGGFTVHESYPAKNLKDLADAARKGPGSVTVGTTGTGSDDHIAMLLFQRASNTTLSHIPYKGAGEVRGAVRSTIVRGAFVVRDGKVEVRPVKTFSAAGPFWPCTMSNSTVSPSASDLKPEPEIAL